MSSMSYIAFPNQLKAFRLSEIKGKEKDYGINYDISGYQNQYMFLFPNSSPEESHVVIVDKKKATFRKCFINKYIYIISIDLPYIQMDTIKKIVDKKFKLCELEQFVEEKWLRYKQIQYNFISENLNSGEFAEVYSVWTDHVNFDFGPPKLEYTMTLDEFLNIPRPDKIVDGQKITLFK